MEIIDKGKSRGVSYTLIEYDKADIKENPALTKGLNLFIGKREETQTLSEIKNKTLLNTG